MKKVLKGAAWIKAPRLMFAKRHPRKAAFLAATSWITSRVRRRQRPSTMTRTAIGGLGAAAVAIPLGVWMGRRMRGGEQPATNP